MPAFTRLGSGLWIWEPWLKLPSDAKLLWLGLYTTGEAKRHAPGLWQGGVQVMAEASSLQPDAVRDGLEKLLEGDLVEYDPRVRVLRLCSLPDPGEFPSNGNAIRSWWTRFKSVPECGVRNAHIATLRWLVDEGARQSGRKVTENHEEAWRETFGTISVPVPRRRGTRSLVNSDTSTVSQPSLFSQKPSGNGSSEGGYPQDQRMLVDSSDALHQHNKNNNSGTVTDTVSVTHRIPDPGSRIPDQDQDLSGEGDWGRGRPALTLVPPFTASQVLAELQKGLWDPAFDKSRQDALSATISAWAAEGVTLADFAFLAEHSLMSREKHNLRWLLGCDIAAEISKARRRVEWRDAQAKGVAESMP